MRTGTSEVHAQVVRKRRILEARLYEQIQQDGQQLAADAEKDDLRQQVRFGGLQRKRTIHDHMRERYIYLSEGLADPSYIEGHWCDSG